MCSLATNYCKKYVHAGGRNYSEGTCLYLGTEEQPHDEAHCMPGYTNLIKQLFQPGSTKPFGMQILSVCVQGSGSGSRFGCMGSTGKCAPAT